MNRAIPFLARNLGNFIFAIALAQSGKAATIDNCGAGIAFLPCYTIALIVPGTDMTSDSELSPVSLNLFGIDPRGVGNGSSFAVSAFGRVGARAEATDTFGPLNSGVSAEARAIFEDSFPWHGGPGILRFLLNLQGSTSVTGDPAANQALVDATFGVASEIASSNGFGRLNGPGSIAITVGVNGTDAVDLDLELFTLASATALGSAVSDFKNTLLIPEIQLLDNSGRFVRDITLTDFNGNVLGAQPATVPEARTLVLMGAGLFLVVLVGQPRKRTPLHR